MTTAAVTLPSAAATSRADDAGLFGRLAAAWRRRADAARIAAELNALDDRDLDDIGVRRVDIPAIARASVR